MQSRFNRNADPRTHTERINDEPKDRGNRQPYVMRQAGTHDNRAYSQGETLMLYADELPLHPGDPVSPDRGAQKPHRMLSKGTHDGVLYHPGQTVMLYDDEVGPHHALIKPEHELARPGLSAAAEPAAPAKRPRKPRQPKPEAKRPRKPRQPKPEAKPAALAGEAKPARKPRSKNTVH
jgi:hypothetical protein